LYPVVFSAAWFAQHQRALLWLLNAPLIGRWFRWVLCIRPHDVGYRARIVQLLPHAYTVENGDGTYTMDCRTHAKYAKRLHYVLWPLWAALHAWDAWVANPFVPALNAGFDTLTVYPTPSGGGFGDGTSSVGAGAWATLFATLSGFSDADTAATFALIGTGSASPNWQINRSVFTFDTSALGAAVISSATFSLYMTSDAGVDRMSISASYDVLDTNISDPANLATSTATLTSASLTTGVVTSATAAAGVNSYVPWTLSDYGRSRIQAPGITEMMVRETNMDVANVEPNWAFAGAFNYSRIFGNFADQTGTASDPKLVVTYSVQSVHLTTLLGTAPV